MKSREEAPITFFRRDFLSQSTKKVRTGTFLQFERNPVSKKFSEKRRGDGTEEVSRFSVENCLSHINQNFVGQPFSVSEIFGYRNILCRSGRGHVSLFSIEVFFLQCQ